MVTDQDSRYTFWIILRQLVVFPTFAHSLLRLIRTMFFP